jgi:hypothetical protein
LKNIFNIIKKGWMKFAYALGWVNTRVLLSLTYIILIAFPAIIFFIFKIDLIKRKRRNAESYWIDKAPIQHTIEQAKHQF